MYSRYQVILVVEHDDDIAPNQVEHALTHELGGTPLIVQLTTTKAQVDEVEDACRLGDA
jgi:hypothetical protein